MSSASSSSFGSRREDRETALGILYSAETQGRESLELLNEQPVKAESYVYELISGVTERGLYVEIIENKCEGMISVKNMTGDYYVYKERTHSLIGENLKRKYQLGDVVYIMVKKANVSKRHLDFELLK